MFVVVVGIFQFNQCQLYALCHPELVEGLLKGCRRVEVVNHNKVPNKVIQQKYNVIKISNFITKKQ
ncbi:MAG: hypothetical protein C0525_04275 [Flavobacterium sp.]|nr:hypothetical protein [Flavobacterium sp.]